MCSCITPRTCGGAENLARVKAPGHCLRQTPGRPAAPGQWNVAKRRKRFVVTTRSKHSKWVAPNLLQRDFNVQQPNQVWVGDVTFVPTQQGWLYQAVLIDLYSRQVIGWSMSNRNNTPLVLGALQMAIARRQPGKGLIHHSDQGQTYAAQSYRDLLAQNSIGLSMSRKGGC